MEIDIAPSTSGDSGSESGDSDKELQIAFQKGWLKPGLNYTQEVTRPKINNLPGLTRKLEELSRPDLPWLERLDVTTTRDAPESAASATGGGEAGEPASQSDQASREDDFARESSFYNMTLKAVQETLPKLTKLGVPVERPSDYFAEMVKSDKHMDKIRAKLISLQKTEEKIQIVRKMRQEKKFALQKQKDAADEKRLEKKQLMEAVKKHKKGMKDQLNTILEKKKPSKASIRKKRAAKDKKYGYGGKKKGAKLNTAASSADVFGGGSSKKTGSGGGKIRKGKKVK